MQFTKILIRSEDNSTKGHFASKGHWYIRISVEVELLQCHQRIPVECSLIYSKRYKSLLSLLLMFLQCKFVCNFHTQFLMKSFEFYVAFFCYFRLRIQTHQDTCACLSNGYESCNFDFIVVQLVQFSLSIRFLFHYISFSHCFSVLSCVIG